ncbi:MAG: hypothetical protein RL757_1532 [Bacteroidota bacterium]
MNQKELYKKFIENRNDVPIFGQSWWLDAVCDETRCEWQPVLAFNEAKQVVAATVRTSRTRGRGFFRTAEMPPFVPFLPVIFDYPIGIKRANQFNFENKIWENWIQELDGQYFISQYFHYDCKNIFPLLSQGFQIKNANSFVLSLLETEKMIFENFRDNVRRNIRKAEKLNIEVILSDDVALFYHANQASYARQHLKLSYSLKFVEKIYQKIKENQAGQIFLARDAHTKAIYASALLVWDSKNAYFVAGGSDTAHRNLGANSLLFWQMIQKMREKGLENFDFLGVGKSENLARFKSSFGTEIKNYFHVQRIQPRLLSAFAAFFKKI